MPSHHPILCRPLLLLPSIFPIIRVFQWVSSAHQVAKVLGVKLIQLQHQSFQWICRTHFLLDWLVGSPCSPRDSQKSLLQHHSSKVSILLRSTFFIVQLLHPYMTTGKTIALTRQTFVSKVMSLLFNMLSQLVITFLLSSKCLFISWLQSPSAVTLEPPKIKSITVSIVSPSICHEVMGPDAMILVFWIFGWVLIFACVAGTPKVGEQTTCKEQVEIPEFTQQQEWFMFSPARVEGSPYR